MSTPTDSERRAVVQGEHRWDGKPDGTIAWWEHLAAFEVYARRYGHSQSAERINERGGFGYRELVDLLDGHGPTTWQPRDARGSGAEGSQQP